MTIHDKITFVINEFVHENGTDKIMTKQEITDLILNKFKINPKSIIPSDYCYNRINKGIPLSRPTLFEHLEKDTYVCLGENYNYNGAIYHKSKSDNIDSEVGYCKNGNRKLYK